jgi:hypothetical protein
MNFTVYWVPEVGADLDALLAIHQQVFPGNDLSIVRGYVKVSVPEGETLPGSLTTEEVKAVWESLPPETYPGG